MKFYCIADEETARGFRLAGVPGRSVNSSREAAEALAEAAAQPEVGIVILTQQLAAGMREQVDTFRFERDRPLLVEIPGPGGPLAGRKSLFQLVRSAVGIQIEQG